VRTIIKTMAKAKIAIIPARGGSKRIPGKNVRDLAGRPMIAYTVEAACASGLFERVVVTTDSREIAKIAERHGAEAPFLREAALADDVTPVSLATLDALQRLDPEGERYDVLAQLMPNCPLRSAEDVQHSHVQFRERNSLSQISVVRYGWQNPWWAMRRNQQFALEPLFPDEMKQRSQDLPELFCPTGAIWWASADALRREKTFHLEGRTGWEIPWERGIDIDTQEDWAMVEVLLKMQPPEPN
jgi:N-acylneuraminate cytidylyltransferase